MKLSSGSSPEITTVSLEPICTKETQTVGDNIKRTREVTVNEHLYWDPGFLPSQHEAHLTTLLLL